MAYEGWQNFANTLMQIYDQQQQKKQQNPTAEIDWGGTIKRLLGGNKTSTDDTPSAIDTSGYSTNNPYLKEVNKVNQSGMFVRRAPQALLSAAQDWESEKKSSDLSQRLAELQLQKAEQSLNPKKLNYDPARFTSSLSNENPYKTIIENGEGIESGKDLVSNVNAALEWERTNKAGGQTTYDPNQYINQFSDGNPWKSYLQNPANFTSQTDVADAYTKAVAWEQDQQKTKSSTSKPESNADETRKYNAVLNTYNQYVNGVKARGDGSIPLKLKDWIRQPENSGLLKTYNQYTGTNLQSLPSRLSTKKPGEKKRTVVRTGTDKVTGKKVVEYSDGTIAYQ